MGDWDGVSGWVGRSVDWRPGAWDRIEGEKGPRLETAWGCRGKGVPRVQLLADQLAAAASGTAAQNKACGWVCGPCGDDNKIGSRQSISPGRSIDFGGRADSPSQEMVRVQASQTHACHKRTGKGSHEDRSPAPAARPPAGPGRDAIAGGRRRRDPDDDYWSGELSCKQHSGCDDDEECVLYVCPRLCPCRVDRSIWG